LWEKRMLCAMKNIQQFHPISANLLCYRLCRAKGSLRDDLVQMVMSVGISSWMIHTPSAIHLRVGSSPGSQRYDIRVLRKKMCRNPRTESLNEICHHHVQEDNIVAGVWAVVGSSKASELWWWMKLSK
jgi:hypothetical protein